MISYGHLLDASALLAAMANEPGADKVRQFIDDSAIHAVNLAEVIRKLTQSGFPLATIERHIQLLNLNVVEGFVQKQAFEVGRMGLVAREYGLSLADCICLTVAKESGQIVVTADRVWSQIPDLGVRILQIR